MGPERARPPCQAPRWAPKSPDPGPEARPGALGTTGFGSAAPEGVLELLAGLLEAGLGLVGAAFGLEAFVAGDPAGGLLELTLDLLGGVPGLVARRPARPVVGCRHRPLLASEIG